MAWVLAGAASARRTHAIYRNHMASALAGGECARRTGSLHESSMATVLILGGSALRTFAVKPLPPPTHAPHPSGLLL